MIKSILKYAAMILLLAMLVGGCSLFLHTADLRTETAKQNTGSDAARALVQAMGKAHGIEHWAEVEAYQADFQDEFWGFVGKSGSPFKDDKTDMRLSYIPSTFDGSLEIMSGKEKGQTWGIQSWQTYTLDESGAAAFHEDKNIYFWLPTYQYFIEFPLRIQEATVFVDAGEKEIEGKLCQGVLASWNSAAPQKDVDQYLIWIDKATNRIVKLEYTIRELYGFLKGAAFFKNYKDYGGIMLPSSLPVESSLQKKGFLHEMRLLDFTPNGISAASLRPRKDLKEQGTQKES